MKLSISLFLMLISVASFATPNSHPIRIDSEVSCGTTAGTQRGFVTNFRADGKADVTWENPYYGSSVDFDVRSCRNISKLPLNARRGNLMVNSEVSCGTTDGTQRGVIIALRVDGSADIKWINMRAGISEDFNLKDCRDITPLIHGERVRGFSVNSEVECGTTSGTLQGIVQVLRTDQHADIQWKNAREGSSVDFGLGDCRDISIVSDNRDGFEKNGSFQNGGRARSGRISDQ